MSFKGIFKHLGIYKNLRIIISKAYKWEVLTIFKIWNVNKIELSRQYFNIIDIFKDIRFLNSKGLKVLGVKLFLKYGMKR